MLGIIGLNGSGKSTLLKVLSGTTPPNYGNVKVDGRLFSMIELSAGMNLELTGRENCRLLGAVMGFTPQEIAQHIPAIEEFCELGDWFDRPIRTYSSGMHARLGFGVAMNVDADIILIDEVLAVGDVVFQKKCMRAIDAFSKKGKSGILSTGEVMC
jgi:ABC-type polysaccharide/polyol phosphate transport system ATPase subunit